MTSRELINKLLNMPLDEEITLFSPEKHIDEYGESVGYIFHITDVNPIDGIVFDDWRNKGE